MISLLVLLLLGSAYTASDTDFNEFDDADSVIAPPPQVTLNPINGIDFGINNYGPQVQCPAGASITGFMIKTGPTNSYFTETAGVTGIQLRCNSLPQKKLTSLHSVGRWEKKFVICPGDFLLTGINLRITREMGEDSKHGASVTGMRFRCADTLGNYTVFSHTVDVPETSDSTWALEDTLCPDLYAVVGFKTILGTVAYGSRLNTVSMLCEKRWDDCRGCDGHGSCILARNATDHEVQVCKCNPGWHGPFCTWHIAPKVEGFPKVVSSDENPYLLEGQQLTCAYNLTLDGSKEDTTKTLVQWFYGEDYHKVIYSGPTLPGHLAFAGVKISCSVLPCDNFPTSFCAAQPVRTAAPVLISGTYNFSYAPVGWKSFQVADVHIFVSNFTIDYPEVKQFCANIGARRVVLPSYISKQDFGIALKAEGIKSVWMYGFNGKAGTCRRFDNVAGNLQCQEWVSNTSPIQATCMRFFQDPHFVASYSFLQEKKNWITAQGTCKQQYAGHLTGQWTWSHIKADTETLKLYGTTQAWNGGSFDADAKIWGWTAGGNFTTITPWLDNEPRLNGYDLSRCVAYITPAKLGSKLWKVNECENDSNPFICEGMLAQISTTTNQVIIKKPDQMYPNVGSLFQVSLYDMDKQLLASETLGEFATPNKITTVPGTQYMIQFKATHDDFGVKAITLPVKTSCDCDLDPYRNGAPTKFTATQKEGFIRFSWDTNSACANSWTLTRDGSFLLSVNMSAFVCGSGPNNVTDPNAFEPVNSLKPGSKPVYCLHMRNNETGYAAPVVCLQTQIEFFSLGHFEFTYSAAAIPADDVRILWQLFDPWTKTGIYTFPYPADVRDTKVLLKGESTATDGIIQLQVQSDKFIHNDILLRLVIYKSTLVTFDPLEFLGAGNYTGVYGCDKWDRFITTHPPFFNLIASFIPWTCYANMTHGVTRKYPIVDHHPLKEVRGRILFPMDDPNIKSSRCSVFNATVCYRHDLGRKTYCNQTRPTGGYTLYVPPGAYSVSAYVEIAGARFMAEPETCVSGGVKRNTYYCYHANTQRFGDYDIFYVKEKRQIRLQAYGGSAVCTQPLGGNAQWKLTSHEDEECRWEATITAQDSDPKDITLYPMRYTARFIGFSNPSSDPNQRGIMEDASAFFRLTYPEGYFANLRGVGVGRPFPAIFEYHPSIQVDIARFGDNLDECNGIPLHPGYPDRMPIRIVVRAWEMFGSFKCPVTGSVLWYDGLIDVDTGNTMNARCNGCYEGCYGDSAGCAIRLQVPKGQMYGEAVIQTIPGRPMANPPWTRSVTVKAFQRGGETTEVSRSIILTGEGTTPVPFADAIPDVLMPSLFLYDPPGGASYAFIESGTVLTDEYTITTTGTTGFGIETQFGMGLDLSEGICVGFGAYACVEIREEIKGGISSSIGFEMTYGGGVGYSNSIKLTTEITTAQDPGLVDGLGDVIVMKVVSFQYLPTYYVKATKFANGTCQMSKTRGANKWLPAVDGLAIYNMWDVTNLVPRLQADLHNLNTHQPTPSWAQDEIEDWANRKVAIMRGIETWKGVIDYWKKGRELKSFPDAVRWSYAQNSRMCEGVGCKADSLTKFEDVVAFGAGANVEYTIEVIESMQQKYDSTLGLELELGLNMKLDFDIFKLNINFEMSLKMKQALTLASSYQEGQERSTKVGFHLNDEDFGDSFTVEIWYNRRYGTPMFKLLGGASRCPWEQGTIQRNKITVSIDADAQYNILPNAIVPYRISIASVEGESLAGMNYLVFQRQETNQNGAQMYWDGLPIDNEFGINLRVSGEYYMDLRRPPDYYNFSGITIDFYDACEHTLEEENGLGRGAYKETIVVTALFLQPCAQIAWSEDWDKDVKYNFVLNAASMAKERIEVSVINPGFPNVMWKENLHFDKVVVLYRHVEFDDWSVAYLDTKLNLPAYVNETDYGYMKFEIDTSEWQIEGEYEIMLKSYCQHDNALPNEFTSQETPTRLGLVDRTPPRIFGFPSPANGRYLPGDVVGLTFQEPIDCNRRNYPGGKFNVTISWGSGARPEVHSADDNYLFFLCDGNQFTITWGFAMDLTPLLEKEVTIRVANIQDVAGNVMSSPVTWTFIPTTYIARSAMLKIDGLELSGVTPAKFIADYYTTNKIVAEDRMVTDNDPFSSFGVAFCSKFDSVVAVERMKGRCELLKYYVDERSNTFVSFAITPGTPSANAIFEQFKNALEKIPKLGPSNSTTPTKQNATTDTPTGDEEVTRKRAETSPNLMGAVNSNSAKTSWDSTTNSDTIRATLKQPIYPMRYFEAIAIVPAGFFVTMAIGIACGTLFLIIILILNKQREKLWDGQVTEREHALLPHSLQKAFDEKKGYELH